MVVWLVQIAKYKIRETINQSNIPNNRENHLFELQSHHDLQSLPQCLHPFGRKLEQVCVNPYHYDRIESGGIQPVLVPVMKSQRQQEKSPELDQKV